MLVIAVTAHTRPIQWTPAFIGLTLFLRVFATGGGWMVLLGVLAAPMSFVLNLQFLRALCVSAADAVLK